MTLNLNGATPLYIQIKDLLQDEIASGRITIGARLPSERELSEAYGVSRMTARQALQLLQQNGYTRRQVGKGTYASRPGIDQELRELTSFTQDMTQRGLQANNRVLVAEVRRADAEIASQLQVVAGAEVVVLRRVRSADSNPIALETAHLKQELVPGLLEKHDFAVESLYRVLQECYGLHLMWASQVIGARMPDRFERQALAMRTGVPVLSLQRVTFNEHDQPIEYVRSCYHSERYQLRTVLRDQS